MIAACASYSDFAGKNMLTLKITELKPWDDNNYVKMIQSYANALNYIYENQERFNKAGFTHIVLVTDNKILHNWIANGESHGHSKWFKAANKPFRAGAEKQIRIDVGLGELAAGDLAYKYCKPEYVNATLEKTYKGIRIVPNEEVKKAEEVKNDAEEIEMFSIEQLLGANKDAADVKFEGFVG